MTNKETKVTVEKTVEKKPTPKTGEKFDPNHHVSISKMLEAGAHFGHETTRWNPKMAPYIHGKRKNIHILDLYKSQGMIDDAYNFLRKQATRGNVVFVGTKKQAKDAVREQAERVDAYYINSRWLGGTLTNFKTIRARVNHLFAIEDMEKNGTLEKLPKKEVIQIKKEQARLENFLGGIKKMNRLPVAVVVLDPISDGIAIAEAKKLNIPVIAICDSNANPDGIDYIIPANDDAIRSLNLIATAMANAVAEAKGMPIIPLNQEIPKPDKKDYKPAQRRDFVKREAPARDNRVERKSQEGEK